MIDDDDDDTDSECFDAFFSPVEPKVPEKEHHRLYEQLRIATDRGEIARLSRLLNIEAEKMRQVDQPSSTRRTGRHLPMASRNNMQPQSQQQPQQQPQSPASPESAATAQTLESVDVYGNVHRRRVPTYFQVREGGTHYHSEDEEEDDEEVGDGYGSDEDDPDCLAFITAYRERKKHELECGLLDAHPSDEPEYFTDDDNPTLQPDDDPHFNPHKVKYHSVPEGWKPGQIERIQKNHHLTKLTTLGIGLSIVSSLTTKPKAKVKI